MHLIYRSKKQTLPVVMPLNKIPNCFPSTDSQQNAITQISRKRSIDVVIGKQMYSMNATEAAIIYNQPQKKTFYRRSKSKKAEGGYLKGNNIYDEPSLAARNKSTQITQRQAISQRRIQISGYIDIKNKSKSSRKLKLQTDEEDKFERDLICQRLLEKEIYCIEEGSDFN